MSGDRPLFPALLVIIIIIYLFFAANSSSLPALSPPQLKKLRHLTIVSLAAKSKVNCVMHLSVVEIINLVQNNVDPFY